MIIDWSLTKTHTHTHTHTHTQIWKQRPTFQTTKNVHLLSSVETHPWLQVASLEESRQGGLAHLVGWPDDIHWYSSLAQQGRKWASRCLMFKSYILICMWQIDLCYSVQAKYRTISQSYTVNGHFNILNSLFCKGLYSPNQFEDFLVVPPSTPNLRLERWMLSYELGISVGSEGMKLPKNPLRPSQLFFKVGFFQSFFFLTSTKSLEINGGLWNRRDSKIQPLSWIFSDSWFLSST